MAKANTYIALVGLGALVLSVLNLLFTDREADEAARMQHEQEYTLQQAERRASRRQRTVKEVTEEMLYLQDPQTQLCFAYFWGGMANGGAALATVSCEMIPTELLLTSK